MNIQKRWSDYSKERLEQVDNNFGVYELADSYGRVIYIGEGKVRDRLLDHVPGRGRSPIVGRACFGMSSPAANDELSSDKIACSINIKKRREPSPNFTTAMKGKHGWGRFDGEGAYSAAIQGHAFLSLPLSFSGLPLLFGRRRSGGQKGYRHHAQQSIHKKRQDARHQDHTPIPEVIQVSFALKDQNPQAQTKQDREAVAQDQGSLKREIQDHMT